MACIIDTNAERRNLGRGGAGTSRERERFSVSLLESFDRIDHIGQQGIFGGSLNVPYALAVDSKGKIYVGENFDGRRF